MVSLTLIKLIMSSYGDTDTGPAAPTPRGRTMNDKLLSAAALIIGGLMGWLAAGEVAARVDSPLLGYGAALGLGVLLALSGAWLLARRLR